MTVRVHSCYQYVLVEEVGAIRALWYRKNVMIGIMHKEDRTRNGFGLSAAEYVYDETGWSEVEEERPTVVNIRRSLT